MDTTLDAIRQSNAQVYLDRGNTLVAAGWRLLALAARLKGLLQLVQALLEAIAFGGFFFECFQFGVFLAQGLLQFFIQSLDGGQRHPP